MTNRDRRRYDMLLRVRNFCATHAQLFPTTSPVHEAFAAIAAEIVQLEALDVAERVAHHAARAERKKPPRGALTRCLRRAGRTARILARTTPQLDARVKLPRVMDDRLLLTIAREFAGRAMPYTAQFAAHGIRLDELQERMAAFERVLQDGAERRDDLVQARARIDAAFTRAMHAVETLDVAVANHLEDDAVALAVWACDRRVSTRTRPSAGRNGAAAETAAGETPVPKPAEAA